MIRRQALDNAAAAIRWAEHALPHQAEFRALAYQTAAQALTFAENGAIDWDGHLADRISQLRNRLPR